MKQEGKFVIRVYGIIINSRDEVLITDEYREGIKMTKFPGGGLHFGEGTIDCLKREIREECNEQEISNVRHFYTTDYFQKALFFENAQLLSIYYQAEAELPLRFSVSEKPFDFEIKEGAQSFRWLDLKNASPVLMSFPLDKLVLSMLIQNCLTER